MIFLSALILGFLGSLHCAGMCGPLALALPKTGSTKASFILGRLAYNLGRILTYVLLGGLFGLIGMSFALSGFQRGLSIFAGIILIIAAFGRLKWSRKFSPTLLQSKLRTALVNVLQRRTLSSVFVLGLLNGLLPCGLVYMASAASLAAGSFPGSMEFMFLFGLGTLPMMLGIGLFGIMLNQRLRIRFQQAIPYSLCLTGILLVLRGMSLGIPYVSPIMASTGVHCCPACH